MRKLAALLLLAAAAGCAPADTWSSRVEPWEEAPLPPEHLLRQPPDFRLFDAHVRKEFFLYFYEDEAVKQEVITVINHALAEADRRPRLATRDEHDYAMAVFIEDWRARGQDDRIRYFNERFRGEQHRKETLLDQQILYKKREIASLEDQIVGFDADLDSRKATGVYAAGDEKFNLADDASLKREKVKAERLLLLAQGRLLVLEYLRGLRDSQYARLALLMSQDEIDVTDVLPDFGTPEALIEQVQHQVQPASWSRPGAKLEVREGKLHVTQTRSVIIGVRDFLERRRVEMAERAKEKLPAAPVQTAQPK